MLSKTTINFYKRGEKPLGRTWCEWTARWWRWYLSVPQNAGRPYESHYEVERRILFLAGSTDPRLRRIVIPSRRAILFPVINFVTSYLEEPQLASESELMAYAKSNIDDTGRKEVCINGTKLIVSEKHRIQNSIFECSYNKYNTYGAGEGLTKGAADGYWVFLKPLCPGEHTIRSFGSCLSGRIHYEVNVILLVQR
jgi:hypothetical protein